MDKALWIILGSLCLAGAVFGAVMTVMAVRFMELGRVIFYGVITVLCLEVAILAFLKLRRPNA